VSFSTELVDRIPIVFGEALVAEPAARMSGDFTRQGNALLGCHHIDLETGGTDIPLTVSPIDIDANAPAIHLSGNFSETPVDVYLAIAKVRPTTALAAFYYQVGSTASERASGFIEKAQKYADRLLPHE
jgi:hypothetical protein